MTPKKYLQVPPTPSEKKDQTQKKLTSSCFISIRILFNSCTFNMKILALPLIHSLQVE